MPADSALPGSGSVSFRRYRPEDLDTCAKLAQEAFPYGRGDPVRNQTEFTMEGYIESSLLWSNWSEVACVSDEVVGFLFGRIETTWKDRSRLKNSAMEVMMFARWILRDASMLLRSLGLMWNVWITELKVAAHRPSSGAEIELLIVDSHFRGKRIGKELVDRFLAVAGEAGVKVVTVYTEDLQSNYQFYERYGFRKVATFRDDVTSYFAGKPSTAIIFALDLRRPTDAAKQ